MMMKQASDKQYLLKGHRKERNNVRCQALAPLPFAALMHYVPEQLEVHLECYFMQRSQHKHLKARPANKKPLISFIDDLSLKDFTFRAKALERGKRN
jgi:hypothetical protein